MTSTQEIVKIFGKVIEFYEGVNYRGKFTKSQLEELFVSRQKYEDEGKDFMQNLVKLKMISFYGVQIRQCF